MEEMTNDYQSLLCVHCKKIFSNKHNLKVHQNTAKYCLKLHCFDLSGNEVFQNQCDYCKKNFTSKQTLLYHLKICKKLLTFEMKNHYEKKLHELEDTKQKQIDLLHEKIRLLENKIRDQRVHFV